MNALPQYRVMIVDDDATIRDSLVDYLSLYHQEAYQLTVDGAESVTAAKALLTTHRYDLIVTDINMTDGDGFAVIRHAREVSPQTRTALLTAYNVEDYVHNAMRAKVYNIFAKTVPFNFEGFSRVVANLLNPSRAFGLHPYLFARKADGSDVVLEESVIRSSGDIMVVFERLKHFLEETLSAEGPDKEPDQQSKAERGQTGKPNRPDRQTGINDMLTALIEAMTNAVYHVHKKPDGSLKYDKGQVIGHLEPQEYVTVSYGRDAERVAFAVSDQGGGITADQVLYWLERNISGAGLMDTHGRGLFLMHRLADRMFINIAPGQRTEIVLIHFLAEGRQSTKNKPIYINQF